jgi:pSer/pThr/pTyr-binding forkhead associated (FHA) protein
VKFITRIRIHFSSGWCGSDRGVDRQRRKKKKKEDVRAIEMFALVRKDNSRSTGFACMPMLEKNVTFGRQKDCDVRLKGASVSRKHCRITVDENNQPVLVNLSSTNPTKVNGHVMQSDMGLSDGDEITVGENNFIFQATKRSKITSQQNMSKTQKHVPVLESIMEGESDDEKSCSRRNSMVKATAGVLTMQRTSQNRVTTPGKQQHATLVKLSPPKAISDVKQQQEQEDFKVDAEAETAAEVVVEVVVEVVAKEGVVEVEEEEEEEEMNIDDILADDSVGSLESIGEDEELQQKGQEQEQEEGNRLDVSPTTANATACAVAGVMASVFAAVAKRVEQEPAELTYTQTQDDELVENKEEEEELLGMSIIHEGEEDEEIEEGEAEVKTSGPEEVVPSAMNDEAHAATAFMTGVFARVGTVRASPPLPATMQAASMEVDVMDTVHEHENEAEAEEDPDCAVDRTLETLVDESTSEEDENVKDKTVNTLVDESAGDEQEEQEEEEIPVEQVHVVEDIGEAVEEEGEKPTVRASRRILRVNRNWARSARSAGASKAAAKTNAAPVDTASLRRSKRVAVTTDAPNFKRRKMFQLKDNTPFQLL